MIYKSIAVIGCDGFIGRALTESLQNREGLSLKLFGRHEQSKFSGTVSYNKFDLSNTQSLERHFENVELVYYLISETIPATSWENPILEIEKNLIPFLRFMEMAAKQKI